jgi:hypothetical protein
MEQILQSMTEGPLGVRSLQVTETIEGTDSLVGVELLVFGDGSIAYVLGAGSENPDRLSSTKVQELAGAEPLVVLGLEGEPLSLEGAWINRGEEAIGETSYVRWVPGTSQAVVLALTGVEVVPDEELLPILPVAYWSLNEIGSDFHRSGKEYIAVAHDEVFELDEGTVQLWFKADNTGGRQTLLSKDGCGYGDGGHLTISLVGGRIEVRLQSSNDSYYIQTGKLVGKGEWIHLAFTFGPQGMKLYLNGELVGESAFAGGLANNREPLVIGASIRANWKDSGDLGKLKVSDSFDGRIDEVAIFGVALNSDQIKQLITAGYFGVSVRK